MVEDILEFWFGEAPSVVPSPDRLRFWFNGGEEADRLIRERFASSVERGCRGEFDDWREAPRGALALIILLDQFPRNIYRNTPQAYACDPKSLAVCLEELEAGKDGVLNVIERAFFYLPLEHSEDLSLQERSVELYAGLLREAPPDLEEICRSFYDYALRHRDIIRRFNRFPHRNQALGRESTLEEVEFLKEPGSSF